MYIAIRQRPVFVYGTSDGPLSTWRIDLCLDQEQARLLQDECMIPVNQSFEDVLKLLPSSSTEEAVSIRGAVTSMIGNVLVRLLSQPDVQEPPHSFVTGLWGPPPDHAEYDGIICWADELSQHHVCVVRSKVQARFLLREWTWIRPGHRASFLQEVDQWSLPEDSGRSPQLIEGTPARVLSEASYFENWKGKRPPGR